MENQPLVEVKPTMEMPTMLGSEPPRPMIEKPSVPPQLPGIKSRKFSVVVAVIIAVVVTAIIAGGGIYWWQNNELKTVQDKLATAQNDLESAKRSSDQEVTSLQEQITKLETEKNQAVTSSEEYISLSDQLNETKLKFALFSWWQVGSIFQDSQNKNKFYFVTNHKESSTVTVASVRVYDFTKDELFQKDGTVSALDGSEVLFSERLPAEREFRSVGIADRKFVFAETHFEDTPAVCATPWISYNSMFYIDLDDVNKIKKDYVLPEEKKTDEQKKFEDCQNSLQ